MNTNMYPDGLKRALEALYSREPVTDAERLEHERMVAVRRTKDDAEAITRAAYKDMLEFAQAHGFDGSPKYRREAIRCLQRALSMIQGGS